MLIYLDSAIPIYYFDYVGPYQVRAAQRLAVLLAAGDEIAVSDLTRLECRVKPLRAGDTLRLAKFDGFFARPDVRIVPLTTAVYDRATLIRAQVGFKALDAIHLAAAVESGCGTFLTNDTRLSRFSGPLTIEVLP
jgi:predicted nucleic acid-binding protein